MKLRREVEYMRGSYLQRICRHRNIFKRLMNIIRFNNKRIIIWLFVMLPPCIRNETITMSFTKKLRFCFTSKSGDKRKFLQYLNRKMSRIIMFLSLTAILLNICGALIRGSSVCPTGWRFTGCNGWKWTVCNRNGPRKLQGRESSLKKSYQSMKWKCEFVKEQ